MAVWLISTPDIFYITFFIFVYIDTNAIYGKTQMIVVNIEKCGHCGACVAVCPTNSIELIESCLRIGDTCTSCATCITVCPVGALTAEGEP